MIAAATLAAGACVPATDLAGQGTGKEGGQAPGQPGGGAGATLVDPAPGATDVPPNLAAFWMRFAGPISLPPGAVTLTAGAGAVPIEAPVAGDCPDDGPGLCVKVVVDGPLAAAERYEVALGAGVEAADGTRLPPGAVGQFETVANVDLVAPVITALSLSPSGPCLLATFQTDEPAAASLRIESVDLSRVVSAGAGIAQFSVAISLGDFAAGSVVTVTVEVTDRAGNRAASPGVPLNVPLGLMPLAITEVHANPAGAEPTQEFVELRNLGAAAVDVGGLAIADAKGMDTLPAAVLAPGAYALVVAAGFDPASAKDTPPLPGTSLVRVDSRIGSDGLSNSGEPLRLLSAGGVVISSYSAAIDVSASAWSGRSVHRVPEDACDQAPSWTQRPSPATPGWGPP